MRIEVLNTKWLNHKVIKVDFEILEPKDFNFKPGQHINIRFNNTLVRPYSIYSELSKSDEISIVVSVGHDGAGASKLKDLKVGDILEALGPAGRLSIKEPLSSDITFVCTGTGIVPFLTILHKFVRDGVKSKIRLYFGIPSKKDIFFKDKLNYFKNNLNDFDYKIVLSDPDEDWGGLKGYVNDKFTIDNSVDTQYYVCGVRPMVKDVQNRLLEQGIDKEFIIT